MVYVEMDEELRQIDDDFDKVEHSYDMHSGHTCGSPLWEARPADPSYCGTRYGTTGPPQRRDAAHWNAEASQRLRLRHPHPAATGTTSRLWLTLLQRAKRDRKYSLATAVLKTGDPPLQTAVFHELVNYVRDPRTALRPEVTVEMTFALRCLQLDYERFRPTFEATGENPLAQPVKAAIAAVWKDGE
ncbi:unnamed protein product [Vitrella brassicaformis CCMP3155]|uniref:Uncharacterized protein n=1 Tax=Vitrella brassicaformis (strain CCMP3155) TaxID=1169540 RepID=A0A0G4G9U8_VITBC|nr:unnamed protein product [Vitrella brassicaformis CCMP3155]|eukprot:CEM25792.1 unnamed protein product [Vitrella brassicaformis CCMP3155]